ncbi:TPA: hypothetical protein ORQ14_004500 [Escherichia coli]|nr:hypothetical protein [Escherichia coli]
MAKVRQNQELAEMQIKQPMRAAGVYRKNNKSYSVICRLWPGYSITTTQNAEI